MQRADHARAVKVEDGIDTFVFNDGMIRLRTVAIRCSTRAEPGLIKNARARSSPVIYC
jgi:hypothetical protein